MAEAVGAFAVDGGEQRGNHKACNEHRILRNEVRTNESQRQDLVDCNRFFGGNMTSAEEEFRRSDVRKGLRKSCEKNWHLCWSSSFRLSRFPAIWAVALQT